MYQAEVLPAEGSGSDYLYSLHSVLARNAEANLDVPFPSFIANTSGRQQISLCHLCLPPDTPESI